eukprot:1770489-Rhodomonas_salina.1
MRRFSPVSNLEHDSRCAIYVLSKLEAFVNVFGLSNILDGLGDCAQHHGPTPHVERERQRGVFNAVRMA